MIIVEEVTPMTDQRRVINSKRDSGPATAFITTEKQMATIVCGSVAAAQMNNMAAMSCSPSKKKGTMPVNAYEDTTNNLAKLNQGTTFFCRWSILPAIKAKIRPVIAGMVVNRLTSIFVPPKRVMNTGRKGLAAFARPIPMASTWT